MKRPLILNDNYIDVDHVSYISKLDTSVKAHLGTKSIFFTIVVDGKQLDIHFESKELAEKARTELISECGATTPLKFIGLLPS